ncbi:nuclear transcription factor Y subunit B-6-like [Gastrolobium bilobum]|uniref:nuclear transcription factor Y subunit B-6-like n=1 Tax=Gastrolobium bilobum TaxID=150636 RepID=UPI002AB0A2A4|nr:nuclear transcription factor Y subunit B-6-like [Gastrolobium bilobum]
MESGGFHGYRKLPNTSSAGLNVRQVAGENNQSGTGTGTEENECMVREQDRFMPIANVIRIMRKILPPHAKISDDAKETIQECVSEYISFITGEANERCQREQRKTITAEDVLWAMSKLGFDDYIEPLTMYLHRYREMEGDRTSMRGEPLGKRTSVEYGTTLVASAAFVPPFHIAHHHHHHPNGSYFGAPIGGTYMRDAAPNPNANAGGSSQAPLTNAEPNGQYK